MLDQAYFILLWFFDKSGRKNYYAITKDGVSREL